MVTPWRPRYDGSTLALTEQWESSMNSMKTYLIVWVAGLVAGLILMERWQRTSGLLAPTAEDEGEATGTAGTAAKVPADQPTASEVIVAGARADVERARRLVERMSPWGKISAPSLPQLRRSSKVASPSDTPNPTV